MNACTKRTKAHETHISCTSVDLPLAHEVHVVPIGDVHYVQQATCTCQTGLNENERALARSSTLAAGRGRRRFDRAPSWRLGERPGARGTAGEIRKRLTRLGVRRGEQIGFPLCPSAGAVAERSPTMAGVR